MRVAEGTEITSIDTRMRAGRLSVAAATRDRIIVRMDFTSDQISEIFAVQLQKTVARTVAFAGDGDGEELMLLGMFDGMLYTLRVENGTPVIKDSRMIGRMM
jgi:hypothetical protein